MDKALVSNGKLFSVINNSLPLNDYTFVSRIPLNNVYYLFYKLEPLFMVLSCIHIKLYQLTIFILMHIIFFFLLRVLSHFVFSVIVKHLYKNLNLNLNLLFYIVFFSLIVGANGLNVPMVNAVNIVLSTVGLLAYIFFFSLYDYYLLRLALKKPLFKYRYINHLVNGLIYVLAIELGIFGTNATWGITRGYNPNNGLLYYIISFIFTVFTSAFWYSLQIISLVNRENYPEYH